MRLKRLYRSKNDAMIAGVCAGIGQFLGIDPTIIRLSWVLVTIFTGFIPGILAYIIAWAIVPQK